MRATRSRIFWLSWVGFTALFLLLQYVVNDTAGGFAIFMSILAAAPVAAILAFARWRRVE
jgi:hypothetical protein